jgi:sec-independent protein translocase protein TatA
MIKFQNNISRSCLSQLNSFGLFLFISGQEIIVVMLVVLLLFGAKSIPDIAKGLGKGMNEFKKATDEIKREISRESDELLSEVKEVQQDIENQSEDLKKNIEENLQG